jgi:peptide-methionine (R)-S-oxide reductase
MKQAIFLTALFLMSFGYGGCQQKEEVKTLHGKNPYYSNTDTSKLNVSNAEWKKILSPE